jgi:hypothetical protein
MPEISRFHGIVIRMFFNDHAPPHFHASHGGAVIHVEIGSGRITVMKGRFPHASTNLVLRWLRLHHDELLANWTLARAEQPPRQIAPLE